MPETFEHRSELEHIASISTRTLAEMEAGALNVGMEAWLYHVSYMIMMQMMAKLIFNTKPV